MRAPPFTAPSLLSPWWNGVVWPLISDSSEKMLYCSGKQPPHIPLLSFLACSASAATYAPLCEHLSADSTPANYPLLRSDESFPCSGCRR